MTKNEINDRINAIIRRLNDLNAEEQGMKYGVTDLEIALDMRRDSWDGDCDCPDPTPEEIREIEAEIERIIAIDGEKDDLIAEYYSYTQNSPYRYECGGDYARRLGEKY